MLVAPRIGFGRYALRGVLASGAVPESLTSSRAQAKLPLATCFAERLLKQPLGGRRVGHAPLNGEGVTQLDLLVGVSRPPLAS